MRVQSLRQHRLRSVPLVHFETVMEQALFRHNWESEGHMAHYWQVPTADGSVAVTRQVTVVLLLVIAVTLYHSTQKTFFRIVGSHIAKAYPRRRHTNYGRQGLESVSMMATNYSNFQGI